MGEKNKNPQAAGTAQGAEGTSHFNDDAIPEWLVWMAPIFERLRRNDGAFKTKDKRGRLKPERAPTVEEIADHFNGGDKKIGGYLMEIGASTTRLGVIDLDDHGGEIGWAAMQVRADAVTEQLVMHGLRPARLRSSGGRGIHLWLYWESEQDAYSVRVLLKECVETAGLENKAGVAEVFPKQDRIPEGGCGNPVFWPIERLDGGDWLPSEAVPVVEKPKPPERPSGTAEVAASLHALASALMAIPNSGTRERDRDFWLRIGMAIHHASAGSAEGQALWDHWSAQNSNYDQADQDRVWESFHNKVNGVTAATIFKLAIEDGWDQKTGLIDRLWRQSGLITLQPAPIQPDIPKSPEPEASSWPPPFRGPMEAVVDAVLKVAPKPQPELTTLAILVAMASACGPYFALPGGGRLPLYGCGIAETGAGKDAPLKGAVELATAGGVQVLGRPASGQGLEDALMDSTGMLVEVDEIAHFFSAINGSRAPSYLIELAGNLLRLFSASSGTYHCRVRANDRKTRTIQNPALNLIGFSTPEKLGEAVTVTNIADGLLGRFVFAMGLAGLPSRRVRQKLVLPDTARRVAQELGRARIFNLVRGETMITITDEADIALTDWLADFDQRSQSATSPFGKALQQRAFEKVERIAGVLAAWDNPAKPVISVEHVAWAARAMRASDDAVLRFAENHMHGGQVQADAQRLRVLMGRIRKGEFTTTRPSEAAVKGDGWVPRSMLLRVSKLDKKGFDAAVAYLVDLRDIELGVIERLHPNGRTENLQVLRLTDGE